MSSVTTQATRAATITMIPSATRSRVPLLAPSQNELVVLASNVWLDAKV